MTAKTNRLYFVDAMRAWAILMMLQGHFIDGLLEPAFRDLNNSVFSVWLYFRGITAPVFFTVSGFIFTYLLIRVPQKGLDNPRIAKGVRRGLQLVFIGYLLRSNLFGFLNGEIYSSFYFVDVLHCIGLSILALIGVYLLTINRKKYLFPLVLLGITLVLFLFEPLYKQWSFFFLPEFIANYFTKVNGSIFTIFPWMGYATIGAFISTMFFRFKDFKYLYPAAIAISIVVGAVLCYLSSPMFIALYKWTGVELFNLLQLNNYLFIRLGDVFIVFAVFMLFRQFIKNKTVLNIGASTLSIYVIHYMVLYGSLTGLGLYRFFHHSLTPWVAIFGAVLFMFVCTFLALKYNQYEEDIKSRIASVLDMAKKQTFEIKDISFSVLKEFLSRVSLALKRLFRTVKG